MRPVSLSDRQLTSVMTAARALEPEKRDVYLRRVGALLNLRGQFADSDVDAAVQSALTGLMQQHEPAA